MYFYDQFEVINISLSKTDGTLTSTAKANQNKPRGNDNEKSGPHSPKLLDWILILESILVSYLG